MISNNRWLARNKKRIDPLSKSILIDMSWRLYWISSSYIFVESCFCFDYKIIYRRGLRNQCAPVTVNTSVGLYMYFDYLHAYSASWLSSSLKNPFWLKMFWSLLIHVQVILHNVLSLVSLISKNSKHGSDMVLLCTKNYLTSWKCHNIIIRFPS